MSSNCTAISCSPHSRKRVDMEICRRNDQIELSELDPFLAELLRQIPASADPGGVPAAEQRIFSAPTNGKEPDLCAEWKQYVEPELRRLFQTATQTVAADLEQLNGNEKSLANRTLRIPARHAEAWLSALNQARLVIAAKNEFTDRELSDHFRSPIGSRRDLSLFQINFYGFLQEFILREIGG
jgi:Domain of unknown function (DUF2017)